MSIPVSQLKAGDSYVSKSGKGGVRTITFLGEIRGTGKVEGFGVPDGITYIERHPRNVPYTHAGKLTATIDQTAREATTLHISTRQAFAKWSSHKVLISFSQ